HHRLAGDRRIGARLLRIADAHLLRETLDTAAVVRFAEIGAQALDYRVADLIERVHLLRRLGIALGEAQARVVKGLPSAIAARQRHRRRLADMADAERIDEPLERDFPARLDGAEQVADRGFPETLDLFEADFFAGFLKHKLPVAFAQRENFGRLPDP